jgi:hypothetical protein
VDTTSTEEDLEVVGSVEEAEAVVEVPLAPLASSQKMFPSKYLLNSRLPVFRN